jgi:DNA-binding NarL/FixJ family response regulator
VPANSIAYNELHGFNHSHNDAEGASKFLTKGACSPVNPPLAPHSSVPSLWPGFLTGQAGQPVRVLLIDDDPNMRRVIAQELLADLRIDLVSEGASVRDGRRLISQSEFDVMLVDLNLGDGTGFSLIEHVKAVRPAAEAVVISTMEDEQHALHAFKLGATGYLVKDSWFGNFAQAVLQVVNGGAAITPGLARRLLGKFEPLITKGAAATGSHQAREKLSEREKGILQLVASGHTSTAIGARLNISGQTVNTHLKNIYRKFNVHNRAQAVSFAAAHGIF